MLDIICVPVIASLVFCLVELYKRFIAKGNEKFVRLIPLISGGVGIIAGIICFYAAPEIILANNLFTAVLVGGASGLSATGCNQIFKQLSKYGISVTETEVDDKTKAATEKIIDTIENLTKAKDENSNQGGGKDGQD